MLLILKKKYCFIMSCYFVVCVCRIILLLLLFVMTVQMEGVLDIVFIICLNVVHGAFR